MTLEQAIVIATKAHEGQVDKGGSPYILHPLTVMMHMHSMEEKIVAVLHDVIEDTDVTLEDLRAEGASEEILEAMDLLTRKEGEKYWDYIKKLSISKLASRVKMGDLIQNMDLSRLKTLAPEDIKRTERYKTVFEYLERRHGYCPKA